VVAPLIRTRALALAARWVLTVVFLAGVLVALAFNDSQDNLTAVPYGVFFAVGLIVSLRRLDNPIGWLFLCIAATAGLNGAVSAVLLSAAGTSHEGAWYVLLAAWAYNFIWLLLLSTSVIFTLLLFPDGLPSRRWRPVFWAAVVATALGAAVAMLTPELQIGDEVHPNPLHPGRWGVVLNTLFAGSVLVLAACAVLSIIAAVLRFHRATGIQRAQMKWLALAAVSFAVCVVTSITLFDPDGWLASLAFMAGASLIPLACGLAILRYHLYDIDRVISRTTSYAIVTGVLLATYAVIVTAATRLLPDSSTLAVAAATLGSAALARPLYRKVQHSVDRRFNRARYDAERTVQSFGARLRQEVHPEAVQGELVAAVAGALQPATVRLWRP
jgi:hypothetical protein